MVAGEPEAWGPAIHGGKSWRVLRRLTATAMVMVLVAGAALATTARLLIEQAETNLTRVPVPALEDTIESTDARHFLLVGSDARDELEAEALADLPLGEFEGQRADTIIYVAISEDREAVSLVSLPRDLLVTDGQRERKLTDTFAGGPDELIRVISENFELPVNHYAAISLGGFLDVVRTIGGVEICLDDPLVDANSGADFDAGCQQMDEAESLAYVRSRAGDYADFERIGRQQQFITAVLSDLIDARILTNPRQLMQLTEDVASNLTTDEGLGVSTMIGLADDMRTVVGDGLPMATVPSYPVTIDGVNYMVPYEPGAQAMFEDVREGRPLADQGQRDERNDTHVTIYSGGRAGAEVVRSTLAFAGFLDDAQGVGPAELNAGETTTVYEVPGEEERAGWVAATLGADIEPLPAGVEPNGADVIVGLGDDAGVDAML